MFRNQIAPDCVQDLFDSARNAADKGLAQYFTPMEVGRALAGALPDYRPVLVDLHCGNGQLLLACSDNGTHTWLCSDITRAPRPENRALSFHFVQADVTRLFQYLRNVEWRGDVFCLNPPWDLHQYRAPLACLGESDLPAVRDTFNVWDGRTPRDCIDSFIAGVLMALDRCGEHGEGFAIGNTDTIQRLILAREAPHRALLPHIWMMVHLGDAFGNSAGATAIYFSREPRIVGTRPKVLDLAGLRAEQGTIRTYRPGISPVRHFTSENTVEKWRAAADGWALEQKKFTGARPEFNIWLDRDGLLATQLSLYERETVSIDKDEAAELHKLNGQRPMQLVLQRHTRDLLVRHTVGVGQASGLSASGSASRRTPWRVDPKVITATNAALADYNRHRAPLWPLTPNMRLGWLDENDCLKCIKDFREGEAGTFAPISADLRRRAEQFIRKPTRENWEKIYSFAVRGRSFWQRVLTLEPDFQRSTPDSESADRWDSVPKRDTIERILDGTPVFMAGRSYKLKTRTVIIYRKDRRRGMDGEYDDVELKGRELLYELTDERGMARLFRTVRPNEIRCEDPSATVAKGEKKVYAKGIVVKDVEAESWPVELLLEHFEIPDVPDIATLEPARYQFYRNRMLELQALTERISA